MSNKESVASASEIRDGAYGRAPSRRVSVLLQRLYSQLDLIIALLLISAPLNFRFVFSAAPIGGLNMLDGSWMVDIPFKFTHGVLLGRDVIFTFGPLFEWMTSAIPSFAGVDIGTIEKSFWVLPMAVSVVLLLISTRLALPRSSAWKRALVLVIATIFCFPDLRQVTPIFALVYTFHVLDSATARTSRYSLVSGGLIALVLALAFLYSADSGFYSLAAVVIAFGSRLLFTRTMRIARTVLLQVVLGFAVSGVVLFALITGWLKSAFWRGSYEMVSNYRWSLAFPMSRSDRRHLMVCLVASLALWLVTFWNEKRSIFPCGRSFLLGSYALSLLAIQSALVRSDTGHILYAICPLVFVSAACTVATFRASGDGTALRWPIFLLSVPFLAGVLLPFGMLPLFAPAQVRQNWFGRIGYSCPPGAPEFQETCLPPLQFAELYAVSEYLSHNEKPSDPIFVFPYENAYGIAAGRTVAGGVLQNYAAVGDYLVQHQIGGLQRAKAAAGVYSTGAVPVDAVSNFTRTPDVWFYLQSHFSTARVIDPQTLIVHRDDQRPQHVARKIVAIGGERRFPVTGHHTTVDLGSVSLPRDADFVVLDVTAAYPPWWQLSKPALMYLRFEFADGSNLSTAILAPPNRRTKIWAFPESDTHLGRFFDPDSSKWHASVDRPAIKRIALEIHKMDAASVVPRSITIHSISAANLYLQ